MRSRPALSTVSLASLNSPAHVAPFCFFFLFFSSPLFLTGSHFELPAPILPLTLSISSSLLSGTNLKVKASLTSSQVPLPSNPQREPPTLSLGAHRLSPAISRWPFPLTLPLQTTNLLNTAVHCWVGFKHIQGVYFNQFLQ